MLFHFIFLIAYEISICSSSCAEGHNFCKRCNPITKLCDKCNYNVFIPDENGGCEGIKKCVVNENYCNECQENGNLCKTCEEGYMPDENGGCTYSFNCEISYEGICLKCKEDFFLVGEDNYNIFDGIKICKTNYSEEFKNCEIIDKIKGNCHSCKEGYFLTGKDKKCIDIPNCEESKYNICKKCSGGYYLDKLQNKCIRQNENLRNCKISIDGKKCYECNEDYFFDENGECIGNKFCSKSQDYKCQKCNEGYYLTKNNECTNEENCLIASKYLGICTLCKDNYYLDYKDGKCKSNQEKNDFEFCSIVEGVCSKCIDGYFIGEDNKCSTTPNCLESENGECLECKESFYLGLDKNCINVENCIYSNSFECFECKDNYYYDKNAQICKISSDEFLNCKIGIEGISCEQCKDNFYLNKTDRLCYSNLDKNNFYKCAFVDLDYDSDIEFCESCIEGYFLGVEDLKCSTVDGCLKTENENRCSKCDSKFYCLDLKTGNCELNYEIEKEEQKIYFNCNETNKEGNACQKCLDGYILNDNGLCVDDIHCVEKSDGSCQRCSNENYEIYCLNEYFECVETTYENCLECNDIFNIHKCTKCYDGYELNKYNICIKANR